MKCQSKRNYGNARYNWAGLPVHKEHLQASAKKHGKVKLEKLMNVLILVAVSKKLKRIKASGKQLKRVPVSGGGYRYIYREVTEESK